MVCLDDLEALAFVGGELPPERLPEVIAHADACAACHDLIEGLCAVEHDARELAVGEIVAGYRIDAPGYLATELALHREVWLKVGRSRTRCERELAARARLFHPAI